MFSESDEWLAIENEFFVIKYHPGQGEEAEEALACAMWVRENTLEKYPHTLNLKVTITLYRDRDEIQEKEGAYTAISHVGSSRASIGILSPSWTGSWGGYEGLDNPFRRILNHEYVHCPFYIDLYTKSSGYKDPQSWFSQGLAEYISDNYLPSYVNRIRESIEQGSFTINEPYTWGLYIVEYMYSKYGMDKVIDIIKSDEPTFNGALEEELGTTPLKFEDGWRRYVADKFGVEYSPPEYARAEFEISDLTITPLEVESGEEVEISLLVKNIGEQQGSHMLSVLIENGQIFSWVSVIDLDGGTNETVRYRFTPEAEGNYNVELNDLTGSFEVKTIPSAGFVLSDLIITPSEIELGDNLTIRFDIMNTDSQSITYIVNMKIENVNDPPPTWPLYNVTLTIYVELEAYESKTVSRTMTMDAGGDFNVTVDGLTGSFKVGTWPPEPPLRPAELVLSDISITPETAELWGDIEVWTFKITANVTNVGEQEGMDTIHLRVDGLVVDWRTVELRGGEKTWIVYDVTRGVGSYNVEVDGLTGSFTVKAPPKPAEFEFSNLRIFYPGVVPPEVERGQTVTVTISLEAENVGDEEGTYRLELMVEGEKVDAQDVTLEGGESVTILFELTRGEGDYRVEIEGKKARFTVNPKPSFWDKIPAFPYESIILGLIAVTIILWYARSRKF